MTNILSSSLQTLFIVDRLRHWYYSNHYELERAIDGGEHKALVLQRQDLRVLLVAWPNECFVTSDQIEICQRRQAEHAADQVIVIAPQRYSPAALTLAEACGMETRTLQRKNMHNG